MESKKISQKSYRKQIKQKLIELRGHQCEQCKLTQWQNQSIPLELHHIDGDPFNNDYENLLLLCPNCHTLTPNYGSKNRKRPKREVSDEEFLISLKENPNIRQALLALQLADAGANYERARVIIQNSNDPELLEKLSFEQKNNQSKLNYCLDCGKIISLGATRCKECATIAQRFVDRPSREILKQEVYNTPFTALGKKYRVSDKTIQKWCKYYNLPNRRQDIKRYSQEEWNKL